MSDPRMMTKVSKGDGFIAALDQSARLDAGGAEATEFPTAPTMATPKCSR